VSTGTGPSTGTGGTTGPRWATGPVVVRAPATSANLGPGFDALGLALALYDVVEARVTSGGLAIEVSGEGADTAGAGERHLVVRAMRAAFSLLGGQPPGIALRCVNAIPHGRGLGSSAAAIVAGVLAARGLVSAGGGASAGGGTSQGPAELTDDGVFRLAVELEGHPDNVAACLAGGLTIAWTAQQGAGCPAVPRLAKLTVLDGICPVVCVPQDVLPTETARCVLPESVPHGDAAANAGRSALLIAGLTSVPEVLFDATEDFLHQRYRAAVMPATADLLRRLRAGGLAAVLSGAGPTVLVLTGPGPKTSPDLVDSIARETGIPWRISPLGVDRLGATFQTAAPDVRP
jgi:homoserine kinase